MPGDVLLGYASTGLHTNGYTLARRIVFDQMELGLGDAWARRAGRVADALLAVHQSYATSVMPVIRRMHGLAHITGGGIAGNLVRVLPRGCEAIVDPSAWSLPPLFAALQQGGGIPTDEMREVFNLGVGLIAVAAREAVDAARQAATAAGVETWTMGEIRRVTPAFGSAVPDGGTRHAGSPHRSRRRHARSDDTRYAPRPSHRGCPRQAARCGPHDGT